uniref:EF-hand domain-containing protein n=1 Tax=Felis catus TaxID=9685 RepID=A0ABI7YLT2_FELCA
MDAHLVPPLPSPTSFRETEERDEQKQPRQHPVGRDACPLPEARVLTQSLGSCIRQLALAGGTQLPAARAVPSTSLPAQRPAEARPALSDTRGRGRGRKSWRRSDREDKEAAEPPRGGREGGGADLSLVPSPSMQVPVGPACIFLRKGIAEKQRERPLGQDEIEELREAFLEFDKDRDGFISCKDLGNLMRTMGYMPTEMELTELGQQIRMNLGGRVDFDDFVELMTPKLLEETAGMIGVQEMRDAFKEFDTNGDGEITLGELQQAMQRLLGEKLTPREISEVVQEADVNGDGTVDFEAGHRAVVLSGGDIRQCLETFRVVTTGRGATWKLHHWFLLGRGWRCC